MDDDSMMDASQREVSATQSTHHHLGARPWIKRTNNSEIRLASSVQRVPRIVLFGFVLARLSLSRTPNRSGQMRTSTDFCLSVFTSLRSGRTQTRLL